MPSSSKNCSLVLPLTLKPVEVNIPPAVELCPVCGLYKPFLKYMLYFNELLIVGCKLFLILIVVIFDRILASVPSISVETFENLKTLSNFCNVEVL